MKSVSWSKFSVNFFKKVGDNLVHFEIEYHVIARDYVIKKNFMCCEQIFNFYAMSHIFHADGKVVEMRKNTYWWKEKKTNSKFMRWIYVWM